MCVLYKASADGGQRSFNMWFHNHLRLEIFPEPFVLACLTHSIHFKVTYDLIWPSKLNVVDNVGCHLDGTYIHL